MNTNEKHDKVEWLRLCTGFGLPAPMMEVFAAEPMRKIEVTMRYADLCFIKQMLDERIADIQKRLSDLEDERHLGVWTESYDADCDNPFLRRRWICSNCGEGQTYGKTKFCPNCGKKMEEIIDDD